MPSKQRAKPSDRKFEARVQKKLFQNRNRIRAVFSEFDERNDGTIGHAEFRAGLQSMGVDASSRRVSALLDQCTGDRVNYEWFLSSMQPASRAEPPMGAARARAVKNFKSDQVFTCGDEDHTTLRSVSGNPKKSVEGQQKSSVSLLSWAERGTEHTKALQAAKAKVLAKAWGNPGRVKAALESDDSNGAGVVTVDEFKARLLHTGVELSAQEVRALVQAADPSNTGAIDYTQFASSLLPSQASAPAQTDPFLLERAPSRRNSVGAPPEPPEAPDSEALHKLQERTQPQTYEEAVQIAPSESPPRTYSTSPPSLAPPPAPPSPQRSPAGPRYSTAPPSRAVEVAAPSVEQSLLKCVNNKPARLKAAFRSFDSTGAGTVTPADFKQALRKLGATLSAPEIARLIARTGSLTQGNIDYEKLTQGFEAQLQRNQAGLAPPARPRRGPAVDAPWGEYAVPPEVYQRSSPNARARSVSAPPARPVGGRTAQDPSTGEERKAHKESFRCFGANKLCDGNRVDHSVLRTSLLEGTRGHERILAQAFRVIDPDKQGRITPHQFRRAMRAAAEATGGRLPGWAVEEAVLAADTGSGQLDYGRMLRRLSLTDESREHPEARPKGRAVPSSGDIIANRDGAEFEYEAGPSKAPVTHVVASSSSGDIICNQGAVRTNPLPWAAKARVAQPASQGGSPGALSAYRTNGDIIGHTDSAPGLDSDALRWNSQQLPRSVGRKRKPCPREAWLPEAPEAEPEHKAAAGVLMRKVRGKKNKLLEQILESDPNGDGTVDQQQLRVGLGRLGLSPESTDRMVQRYDQRGTGVVDARQMCHELAIVDAASSARAQTPRQRQPFTPRNHDVLAHSEEVQPALPTPTFARYADQDPLNRQTPRSVSTPRARPDSDIISWTKPPKQPSPKPAPQLHTPAACAPARTPALRELSANTPIRSAPFEPRASPFVPAASPRPF